MAKQHLSTNTSSKPENSSIENSLRFPKRTALIDAYSYFYKFHYAFERRPLTNLQGENTSIIFSFLNLLVDLVRKKNYTQVVCVLDSKGPTFRHELDKTYKANRPPMPDDIRTQSTELRTLIPAMGVPMVEKPGFEADDIIAQYAHLKREPTHAIDIYSSDKDLMQLVNENTFMVASNYAAKEFTSLGRAGVFEKYGVHPTQIVDYLSLLGDTADNVPGVRGIGKVTACKLLKEYGTLEEIYARQNQLTGSVAKKIADGEKSAFHSKKMIVLNHTVPEMPTLEKMPFAPLDMHVLSSKLRHYECISILEKIKGTTSLAQLAQLKTASNKLGTVNKSSHEGVANQQQNLFFNNANTKGEGEGERKGERDISNAGDVASAGVASVANGSASVGVADSNAGVGVASAGVANSRSGGVANGDVADSNAGVADGSSASISNAGVGNAGVASVADSNAGVAGVADGSASVGISNAGDVTSTGVADGNAGVASVADGNASVGISNAGDVTSTGVGNAGVGNAGVASAGVGVADSNASGGMGNAGVAGVAGVASVADGNAGVASAANGSASVGVADSNAGVASVGISNAGDVTSTGVGVADSNAGDASVADGSTGVAGIGNAGVASVGISNADVGNAGVGVAGVASMADGQQQNLFSSETNIEKKPLKTLENTLKGTKKPRKTTKKPPQESIENTIKNPFLSQRIIINCHHQKNDEKFLIGEISAAIRAITSISQKNKEAVTFDLETTSLDPYAAEIIAITFCWQTSFNTKKTSPQNNINSNKNPLPISSLYIRFAVNANPAETKENVLKSKHLLLLLKPFFENPNILKNGHNLKFEYAILFKQGITLQGIAHDTMVYEFLKFGGRNLKLENLSQRYLGHTQTSYKELTAKQENISLIAEEKLQEYALQDSEITHLIYLQQKNTLPKKMETLFQTLEIPLITTLAEMELVGICLDTAYFAKLSKTYKKEIAQITEKIYFLAERPFNINSTKELQTILYENLELIPPPGSKNKTGFSTDFRVLEKLTNVHPIAVHILEYRKTVKLLNTYVEVLPTLINEKTNRIHTSFNQTVAATGRLSSNAPNLQNIPIYKDEKHLGLRRGFIAGNKEKLISIDYSQVELRVLAKLSNDASLKNAYLNNADIHKQTAALVFGKAEDEVTPLERSQAKTINFSVIYGISAYALGDALGLKKSHPELNAKQCYEYAQSIIDAYYKSYPGFAQYQKNILEEAREKLYVQTYFGRKRHLPAIVSANNHEAKTAERMAFNSVIQGTAADIIKIAMNNIAEKIRNKELPCKLLLQVHDELVFSAKEKDAEKLVLELSLLMTKIDIFAGILEVDSYVGDSWEK